jgi:hypothetical protein
MVKALCTTGNHEILKCSVHGAAGLIAGLMAAYNMAACCFRRDRHLKINSVVYALLVAYEVKQTLHHLSCITAATAAMARQEEETIITEKCA